MSYILARRDLEGRYRRSVIGPFWITISIGVTIASIGLVFGQLFGSPMETYLPYLAVGLIVWNFISSTINGGTNVFISAQSIIKQLSLPYFVHILRSIMLNTSILLHNLLAIPIVFLFMRKSFNFTSFIIIPGFFILMLNLCWVIMLVGLISTRFRDFPEIISSILQVLFYITPIIWMPSLLPNRVGLSFIDINPVYHFLELIRTPLLGSPPDLIHWVVCIAITIIGWAFTLFIYFRFKNRIPYWL